MEAVYLIRARAQARARVRIRRTALPAGQIEFVRGVVGFVVVRIPERFQELREGRRIGGGDPRAAPGARARGALGGGVKKGGGSAVPPLGWGRRTGPRA